MVEAKQKLEKTDTDLIEQFNEVKVFFRKERLSLDYYDRPFEFCFLEGS